MTINSSPVVVPQASAFSPTHWEANSSCLYSYSVCFFLPKLLLQSIGGTKPRILNLIYLLDPEVTSCCEYRHIIFTLLRQVGLDIQHCNVVADSVVCLPASLQWLRGVLSNCHLLEHHQQHHQQQLVVTIKTRTNMALLDPPHSRFSKCRDPNIDPKILQTFLRGPPKMAPLILGNPT